MLSSPLTIATLQLLDLHINDVVTLLRIIVAFKMLLQATFSDKEVLFKATLAGDTF